MESRGRLGVVLFDFRVKAGLTQEELAEKAGLSVRGISDLERGHRKNPRLYTLRVLSDALGLSADDRERLRDAGLRGAADPEIERDERSQIRGNLPHPPNSFVGRVKELREISDLLQSEDIRLLTLAGAGGSGKTRLAMRVGDAVSSHYPDGVFLAELVVLTEPTQVMTSIRASLGLQEGSDDELETTRRWIGDKRVLLIADNFEHVVPAGTGLSDLLQACPQLQIMVTSRVCLRTYGEHVYDVPPFSLPRPTTIAAVAAESEAVQLFTARAKAARHEFTLTDKNAGAVAGICIRVDGLPLAIELAAARIRMFSPQQLLERLESGTRGGLNVLTGAAMGGAPRHETLRATMAWSYDLLDERRKTTLKRLSVFRGGCTFEAAEEVCSDDDGDVASDLHHLIESSLLTTADSSGRARYRMLETVREYIDSGLSVSERANLSARHAEFFLRLSVRLLEVERVLLRPVEAWDAMEADHQNFVLAIRTLESIDRKQDATTLAGSVAGLWMRRGHINEGTNILARLLTEPEHEASYNLRALWAAGSIAIFRGDLEHAEWMFQRALEHARRLGELDFVHRALHGLGEAAFVRGELDRAMRLLNESSAVARRCNDRWGEADAWLVTGNVLVNQHQFDAAVEAWARAGDGYRLVNNPVHLASTIGNTAEVLLARGELSEAELMAREAVTLAKQGGDLRTLASSGSELAYILRDSWRPVTSGRPSARFDWNTGGGRGSRTSSRRSLVHGRSHVFSWRA